SPVRGVHSLVTDGLGCDPCPRDLARIMTRVASPERTAAPRRRGDVDARITAAVLELLRTRGPLAVSVEAVAAESGVAKTTIYRRFRNREALLAAVVNESAAPQAIPPGLDARETIAWVLRHARDTIDD